VRPSDRRRPCVLPTAAGRGAAQAEMQTQTQAIDADAGQVDAEAGWCRRSRGPRGQVDAEALQLTSTAPATLLPRPSSNPPRIAAHALSAGRRGAEQQRRGAPGRGQVGRLPRQLRQACPAPAPRAQQRRQGLSSRPRRNLGPKATGVTGPSAACSPASSVPVLHAYGTLNALPALACVSRELTSSPADCVCRLGPCSG
jgi:hypothetical protein